jgi:5-methylthioadenosine/S-adenosylhomocysteine deaminase
VSDRRQHPVRFRAKWIFLPGGRVRENAAVEVVGARIGRVDDVRGGEHDLGEVLLTPGMVDAHVHLELSGFSALSSEGGFATWAGRLALNRMLRTTRTLARAAHAGLVKLADEGVTCVGELATVGAAREALRALGMAGVWYREIISPRASRAVHALRAALVRVRREAHDVRLTPGLFPHAPYSASFSLVRRAARRARSAAMPLAVHASETREEVRLFREGAGPLRRARRALGGNAAVNARGITPIEWLDRAGALYPGSSVVHATHATPADIERMAARGNAVVVCPRSALHLQGTCAEVPRLLASGVPVGIGTDSPASGGTPSLREEMRVLARVWQGIAPAEILRAATEGGAQALGLSSSCGALRPRARADLAAFEVRDAAEPVASAVMAGRSWTVMRAGTTLCGRGGTPQR